MSIEEWLGSDFWFRRMKEHRHLTSKKPTGNTHEISIDFTRMPDTPPKPAAMKKALSTKHSREPSSSEVS